MSVLKPDYEVGDVVKLTSANQFQKMCVEKIDTTGKVVVYNCVWFDLQLTLRRDTFSEGMLEYASDV